MRKTKNNSVILEITADKFELPVNLFYSTKDMALRLNISQVHARTRISKKQRTKNNTYFVKVYIGETNEV